MKIGLIPVNVGIDSVDQMVGLAQYAESIGVESAWTFEHTMVPLDYTSKYPYSPSGKMGGKPDTNFIDPLIALTAVAAKTTTLRLGTGVNIVAQANPLLLAKQAASLDLISSGRFMLGAGIGWLQEEFDAMGVPFERRGARFDDYIVAMKKVWSGEVVEHQSDFINWSGFKSYPVPVQKSGIPIIMGGTKGKIYERLAKHADGWFAPTVTAESLVPLLEPLKASCAKFDRDYDSIEITTLWNNQGGLDAIKAFADLGVSRVIVPVFALDGDPVTGLTRLGEEIIAKL
ncbi:MAG: LLM class F420-dependent oxidoreductase [Gammaproteobacteria bacterium]|nr:MAG: LLM class F420-dependent oxidoreductase [Gammaproteobacteria bacterium]RLA55524.1 MAG: LLM class F420-dependent oxidoreductase [Gammaproteobacteria bacterium]